MYKNGRHFAHGQLTEEAKPYFIYRRARCVALRPVDGRGPIVATADGECAPCDTVTATLQPLAGRILLPKPAYERFLKKTRGRMMKSGSSQEEPLSVIKS